MVKLPLLFVLTLTVTLPSLYVFNALVGSRLRPRAVFRLLASMLAVMLAVIASLGPIVAFFGLSTTSYPFMKLLNVGVCALGGLLGLAFLLRTMQRIVLVQDDSDRPVPVATATPAPAPAADLRLPAPAPPPTPPTPSTPPTAPTAATSVTAATPPAHSRDATAQGLPVATLTRVPDPSEARARRVFGLWIVVFAFVGAQMAWVLRPFIGDPDLPFTWLRSRESNFFLDVFEALFRLMGA